jgi:hypothetical protein
MSFFASGFYPAAIEAFELGLTCKRHGEGTFPGETRIAASMQEHLERAKTELERIEKASAVSIDTDG